MLSMCHTHWARVTAPGLHDIPTHSSLSSPVPSMAALEWLRASKRLLTTVLYL